MGTFLISLITGIVAGALSARYVVRYELERAAANAKAAPPVQVSPPIVAAPPPLEAPVPAPIIAAPVVATPVVAAPVPVPAPHDLELSPEILTVLTAAVAAFLGKRARIRSARVRPSGTMDSAWAQQGRVFVQASHNLSMSRH